MITDTQIVKGLLEGCVLGIIEKGEIYGYKAVEILNQSGFTVNEATVYPILARLELQGFLSVSKRPSPLGPMRKYYQLTQAGQASLAEFAITWGKVSAIVNGILGGVKNEQPQ